jgi:hypothetical protein
MKLLEFFSNFCCAKAYVMDGVELYFESDQGLYRANTNSVFVIKQAIERGSKIERVIPNLLGRDFLNQMALVVDRRNDFVLITDEVLTA